MGMPIITPGTGTRDQAITDLIQSVALQETALAHIINAEGEKMQAIIQMPDVTTEQLMELNDSVNRMLNSVARLEMLFQTKLELFPVDAPVTPEPGLTAPAQLSNIDVGSVIIDIPLDAAAAEADAIALAINAAQNQVAAGYTVTFEVENYTSGTIVQPVFARAVSVAYWLLTGRYRVTKDDNPLDTALGELVTILVYTTYMPSTAADEFAKINVNTVSIAVPLDSEGASDAAVTSAIAAAAAQVSPAYTVSFARDSYDPVNGILYGKYTVTNPNDPSDMMSDIENRAINVTSTYVPTTPEDELNKINVTTVAINVPVGDATARDAAVAKAIAAATAQVSPDYAVSFTPVSYDLTDGTLTGRFTITNVNDLLDTATDTDPRTIIATYEDPGTITASSNAAAQFLSGTLLGNDLGNLPGLEGASASYVNGVTPGTEVSDAAQPDFSVLDQVFDLNGVPLNLVDFLQIGLVNQYAQASVNGASRAYAGAVSDSGVVSLDGTGAYPADAKLDLMQLIPGQANDILSTANITLGAITGEAGLDLSADPDTVVQDYNIAGAGLELTSPLIGSLTNGIDTVLSTVTDTLNGISTTITSTINSAISTALAAVSVIPGITVGTSNIVTSITIDPDVALAPILSEPIVIPGDLSDPDGGSVTLDLSAGSLVVDLAQFWGGTLNNLPPNTILFGTEIVSMLEDGKTELLVYLTNLLSSTLNDLLNTATVTISGGVDITALLISGGLSVSFSGTVAELLSGDATLQITLTDTLSAIPASALTPILDALQLIVSTVIQPAIFGDQTSIVNIAWEAMNDLVNTALDLIEPAFGLLAGVITINANVQSATVDTVTEIPLQLSLLGTGLAELSLGKAVAGPNSYVAPV